MAALTSRDEAAKLKEEALKKVREEAERIVDEARRKAQEIIRRAEEEKKRIIEEELRRIKEEIEYDAHVVEARIESRNTVTKTKGEIVQKLREKVVEVLVGLSKEKRRESIKNLLREIMESEIFGNEKIKIYVVPEDRQLLENVVQELGLRDRVSELGVLDKDMIGGVIVESEDGSVVVDNSYKTRIETVMRRNMPWINRELFG
ncbi:MAG: hypothetical protein DRO12_04275 [Thermoprotei archaeon]|nr:MAG: hypothetical protein DRO12_04275 [Thermoprotei archaeon]